MSHVGIGEPWQITTAGERPFVEDGSCFFWLHTHTEDGVVHIESPVRRTFTLGDFFGIWQIPLSSSQVGPAAMRDDSGASGRDSSAGRGMGNGGDAAIRMVSAVGDAAG